MNTIRVNISGYRLGTPDGSCAQLLKDGIVNHIRAADFVGLCVLEIEESSEEEEPKPCVTLDPEAGEGQGERANFLFSMLTKAYPHIEFRMGNLVRPAQPIVIVE